jgi:hypothetical protein
MKRVFFTLALVTLSFASVSFAQQPAPEAPAAAAYGPGYNGGYASHYANAQALGFDYYIAPGAYGQMGAYVTRPYYTGLTAQYGPCGNWFLEPSDKLYSINGIQIFDEVALQQAIWAARSRGSMNLYFYNARTGTNEYHYCYGSI